LNKKWAEESYAKKLARAKARANLSDFDRFKVMVNRKQKAFKVRQLAKKILGGGKKK